MDENETVEGEQTAPSIEIPESVATWSTSDETTRDETLTGMFADQDDETVDSIAADIVAEIGVLSSDLTPSNVERMESLAEYLDVVEAEQGRRGAAAAELADRAAAITGRLGDAEIPEGEGEEIAPVEAEAEVVEPAIAAKATGSGLAAKLAADKAKRAPEPRPAAPTLAQEAERIFWGGRTPTAQLVTTAQVQNSLEPNMDEGEVLTSMSRLGEIIWAKWFESRGRTPSGLRDNRVPLATARIDFGSHMMSDTDYQANYAQLAGIATKYAELATVAVAAAGGICTPPTPRYEVDGTAVPHNPVEDNLTVLGVPRGAVTWVPGSDWLDMLEGVGTVTDAEDRVGYGSGSGEATPKPCVVAPCPDAQTKRATAVSHCIQFGNLTFEAWPEYVARLSENLMAAFARVKEVFYLDRIDEDSTTVNWNAATTSYGFARALRHILLTEAHHYRKTNGMDIDATLDTYVPDFVAPGVLADWANDAGFGVEQFWRTYGDATRSFESFGLNIVWYYDSATGEGQAFQEAYVEGAAGDALPTNAVIYMHAPGTFVRFDMGLLNVGLVRDSILNEENNLQIFAEQFIEVGMFGFIGLKLNITGLCPNGEAPAGVTAITCS